jgi:hypothetical protein
MSLPYRVECCVTQDKEPIKVKRISMIAILAVMGVCLAGTSLIAMQRGRGGGGGGGGGRPAGAGGPSNAGGRGNFPSLPPQANAPQRSGNPGNSGTRGQSEDRKPESAGPKDANGFKNYGQYMAAKHAADQLNIPIADLQKSMIDDDMSLGESIHKARPNLSKKEVEEASKKAEDAGKKADEARKKQEKS